MTLDDYPAEYTGDYEEWHADNWCDECNCLLGDGDCPECLEVWGDMPEEDE